MQVAARTAAAQGAAAQGAAAQGAADATADAAAAGHTVRAAGAVGPVGLCAAPLAAAAGADCVEPGSLREGADLQPNRGQGSPGECKGSPQSQGSDATAEAAAAGYIA